MEKFIENLYYLLECSHISKTQFLKELHLGKNAISNWRKRDSLPNGNTLVAIADYFDVSLDYLVGRSEKYVKIGGSGSGMVHFSLKRELIQKMKENHKESD